MHMDLTRSTTSRHAAIVKRTFNRARDPQRMWISRDYHKMRCGQKHSCVKSNFCGKNVIQNNKKGEKGFSKKIKKISFFLFEKRISKKNIEKWWKNSFSFQMSNNRYSENIFLEGFKQEFWCQKKRSLYFVWKNKIEKKEKEWNKKGDRTKKNLQKGMNKWKKFCFSKKNKGDFFKKVSHQEKTEET